MIAIAPSRLETERKVQALLIGSAIERITYSTAHWDIVFLGAVELQLYAAELGIVRSTLDWPRIADRSLATGTMEAVKVGGLLLSLANGPRVLTASIAPSGDLHIEFVNGAALRVLGIVPNVDWIWSLDSPSFKFTCDGTWDV